jgi:hypothetical protein
LQHELYEDALTVLNEETILPIKDLQNEKIAYVKLVMLQIVVLLHLKKYTEVTEISDTNLDSLQLKLNKFTKVIIGHHTLILLKEL